MSDAYWKISARKDAIVILCIGHDKEGTVGVAVERFLALAQPLTTFTVIADLSRMVSYEPPSRVAWQEAFFSVRKKIRGLILVGCPSTFIRVGATAVGIFARIPTRFVPSWRELPAYAADLSNTLR